MSIILVGNGSSVLQSKRGQEIDKFDVIVRFNNFQLDGFVENVGSKTDIIARRSCDDIKLYQIKDHKPHIIAFVSYGKWHVGMAAVARNLKGYYKNDITIVGVDECQKFGEEIGLEQPGECASIGALAISHYLNIINSKKWFVKPAPIVLYGFDGTGETDHYFAKKPVDGNLHNYKKEQIWIQKLIQEGKVKLL